MKKKQPLKIKDFGDKDWKKLRINDAQNLDLAETDSDNE